MAVPVGAQDAACTADADDEVDERAPDAGAPAAEGDPWSGDSGYTLDDTWDEMWSRIFARGGRPDPDGPMLQRFAEPMAARYPLDLHTQDFPMASERPWAQQRTGARMWVRSLNAIDLASRVQLRTELPAWKDGYVGLQYDQRQDWLTDLRALRFDVGHRDIGGSGVDAGIRVYPRFDKNDIDVEARARYRVPELGEARLRVGALDPFINATFAIIEHTGGVAQEHIWQLDVPLAVSADVRSASLAGLRAELYGGTVIPQQRRHRFPDAPERDHVRGRRALLGAALVEWRVPDVPVALGATALAIDAHMDWEYSQADGDDDVLESVRETTRVAQIYALSQPHDSLRVRASLERTSQPEIWSRASGDDAEREDTAWLGSIRGMWMATDVIGADLQYLGLRRRTEGPPDLPVDGRANRFVTRIMLQLGDDVWTSFGAGWTLDSDSGFYDRAGMTLIYTPE